MIVLDQALSFLYEPITTNMLKDKQRKILLQLLLVDRISQVRVEFIQSFAVATTYKSYTDPNRYN